MLYVLSDQYVPVFCPGNLHMPLHSPINPESATHDAECESSCRQQKTRTPCVRIQSLNRSFKGEISIQRSRMSKKKTTKRTEPKGCADLSNLMTEYVPALNLMLNLYLQQKDIPLYREEKDRNRFLGGKYSRLDYRILKHTAQVYSKIF